MILSHSTVMEHNVGLRVWIHGDSQGSSLIRLFQASASPTPTPRPQFPFQLKDPVPQNEQERFS